MEWASGINLNVLESSEDLFEDLAADSWSAYRSSLVVADNYTAYAHHRISIDPHTNKPVKNSNAEFLDPSWKLDWISFLGPRKRKHSGKSTLSILSFISETMGNIVRLKDEYINCQYDNGLFKVSK